MSQPTDAPAPAPALETDIDPAMPFEAALAELEQIVRALESGDASLDQSVALYARGQALRAHCDARLNAAEARVERVSGAGDTAGLTPFDSTD